MTDQPQQAPLSDDEFKEHKIYLDDKRPIEFYDVACANLRRIALRFLSHIESLTTERDTLRAEKEALEAERNTMQLFADARKKDGERLNWMEAHEWEMLGDAMYFAIPGSGGIRWAIDERIRLYAGDDPQVPEVINPLVEAAHLAGFEECRELAAKRLRQRAENLEYAHDPGQDNFLGEARLLKDLAVEFEALQPTLTPLPTETTNATK